MVNKLTSSCPLMSQPGRLGFAFVVDFLLGGATAAATFVLLETAVTVAFLGAVLVRDVLALVVWSLLEPFRTPVAVLVLDTTLSGTDFTLGSVANLARLTIGCVFCSE